MSTYSSLLGGEDEHASMSFSQQSQRR